MEQENTKNQALKFAIKLISLRKRSVLEITKRLRQKKFKEEIIEETLATLNSYSYLNDEEFAEAYLNDRLNFNPRGSFLIKKELQEKGIAEQIINKKIAELLPVEKEIELAQKAAGQKLKTLNKDLDKQKVYQKINAYLQSKGYSSDIIRKVLEKILNL